MQLTVDNLAVMRGGRDVLAGISFRLGAGEALVLTGPNGAGKTTLLRTLAGLLPPTHGALALEGAKPADLTLAEHLHFIGHQNAVKTRLTVRENLAFWQTTLGATEQQPSNAPQDLITHALDRLDLVGLGDIEAGYLSAGQRRRLALARLLVAERPLWLLDEPTVSLDAASVARFSEAIGAHLKNNGMVIAATHIPLGLTGVRELALVPKASAP